MSESNAIRQGFLKSLLGLCLGTSCDQDYLRRALEIIRKRYKTGYWVT